MDLEQLQGQIPRSPERIEQHNAEQRRVWEAFRAGRPIRPPVTIGMNVRMILLDPALNEAGISFERYTLDPATMMEVQLRFAHWVRHEWWFDHEMGLPADGWSLAVDYQNMYEAAWLGAPIHFPPGNCPYASPLLVGDRKRLLLERGVPDAFQDGGWMQRMWDSYEYLRRQQESGYEFASRPIRQVEPCGTGTDGPFTLLMALRGGEACVDMLEDPDYFAEMMELIVEATVGRIRAFRRHLGRAIRSDDFAYADDSIALLSVEQVRRYILPYHRKLIDQLWTGRGQLSIHLCGDASRHFALLREELGVTGFDTGFPIDLHAVRRRLGPEVLLQGGPAVELLRQGPIERIVAEVGRLLAGPAAEGRFVLREGNNLAPG
ncbi:MAG: uroporphyrinogen decarboxylase family protein, partial [Phycisphaerae bacterium]